ncbi:MAG: tRNA pseudouridine(55) synthase TruB [Christensenellales bacterium]|jgi:tRNA pseudouridine55 synthase
MDGFLCVNKPLGMTSSDVVVRIRKRLARGVRVGHGGTLDPDASGVLPICIGGATRLFDYIIDKEKTYIATLRLGITTDTQDATGAVIETRAVVAGADEIRRALPAFIGEIEQIPPMYSAIKRDGKRLYQLARKGETIEVAPRKCRVDAIELIEEMGGDSYRLRVVCGKGVYIRTLCHDIGAQLGCGGHMAALTRVGAGAFRIEDAHTPDEICALADAGELSSALLPMDYPLAHIPAVHVGDAHMHAVKNGNPLKPEWLDAPAPEGIVRVYVGGRFCGIGQLSPAGVRFRAMLL